MNASSEQEEQEARTRGMKEFEQTLKEGEELAAAEGKAFVNMTDPHGRTPVMWVCYANYNNIETTLKLEVKRAPYLARLLEEPRVEIDQKDKDGWTALHWASWSGLDRLSDMLIEKKADINNREGNGFTPLMLAAMRGNFQVAALLLEKGADMTAVNKFGKTPFSWRRKGPWPINPALTSPRRKFPRHRWTPSSRPMKKPLRPCLPAMPRNSRKP